MLEGHLTTWEGKHGVDKAVKQVKLKVKTGKVDIFLDEKRKKKKKKTSLV